MLHITGSMRILKNELRSANSLINDILGALGNLKPSDNYTKILGPLIVNMPEFKVLAKDADSAKRLLRRVCSGEVEPAEAFVKFFDAQDEIQFLKNMLDAANL